MLDPLKSPTVNAHVNNNLKTTKRAGAENEMIEAQNKHQEQMNTPEYQKSKLKSGSVEQRWGGGDDNLKSSSNTVRQSFETDQIFQKGSEYRKNNVSGNQVLKSGITNTANLQKDTGNTAKGSNFVGNNNILDTWKKANAKKKRGIVMEYSKKPGDRRGENLKSNAAQKRADALRTDPSGKNISSSGMVDFQV